MISICPSNTVSANTANELNRPTTTEGSATSHVIEFFHKRLKDIQTFPESAQSTDGLASAGKRIEQLLRFTVTKAQPSIAEHIGLLIESSHEPLTDTALRSQVEQRLNEPSAIDSQKTYAQLIEEILDSSAPHTPNARPAPPRLRRDLQAPEAASPTRNAAVRQFSDALIDKRDRQLAIGVANSLMRQRRAVEKGHASDAEDKVAVPADSTFGQAWAELADALHSEPFKSFAEARKINVSGLMINSRGQLTEMRDNVPVNFYLHRDADWAAASAGVISATGKVLDGKRRAITFHDREHASAYNIASFYGLQLGGIRSDDTLFSIGQLLREGTFPAFSSTDPHYATVYAPVKQRQREASQRIMDLSPDQLTLRLDQFTPSTVEQKVQEADRNLAQQCGQAMMKLAPQLRIEGDEFPPVLKEIPEYSTFNQVRKNLLDALAGSTFTSFAQENNVEPDSVLIHPVSGDLTGKVNGQDTLFVPNDLSGWGVVWAEIAEAVRQMAAGGEQPVRSPSPPSAPLYEVMNFYNEEIPRQQNGQQSDWRQRALVSFLDRSIEITDNNGFKALTAPRADSIWSRAVRERQVAITQQLADTPTSLSKLETLAAAVESSSSATVGSALSPQDALISAESALAAATHRVMREVKNTPTQASTKMIGPIPAGSLFGQWRSYLDKAIKARGFTEWAEKHKVDLTSLRFDPNREALIGKVDGVDRRFSAADFAKNYPGHFDVLTPVLNAARVFATPGRPITLSDSSTTNAPLEWVGRFYGITTQPGSQAFERSMTQLDSMKKFPRSPDHPERVVNWLDQQKTAVGDSNDRYALINQLKQGNISNDDTTRFIVDQDSSHRPKGVTTVQKFLADQGWFGATSAAQVDNLLRALQTPAPQAPILGNSWGFLATDLPLSTAQRDAVSTFVKHSIGTHPNLFSYLSAHVPQLSSSPAQALDQLLSSDSALELATNLQTEMKGAVTSTSLKQWLLTALVLELDPAAGTSRNTLAGFDLMQSDKWGLGTDKIREQLRQHLTDVQKLPANLAPVAAHLLMTGAAPHLLISNVPSTMTLGSIDWVSFVTAINRIELNAPGAASGMTFEQVMELHRISPISERESQLHSVAQMNPVMDWAIVNGHIVRNDKDEYTLEQLTNSQEKLKKQINDVSDARHYLGTFKPPSRRKMALSELREKWGADIHYERPYLTERVGPFGVFSNTRASIVDVYEAGRLGESWRWESTRGPDFDALRARASELPDINAKFNQAFEEDYALRRTHTISLFKNMFSQLPLADRDIINNGSATILQVKGTDSGILMLFTHKEQSRTFAIYPASGKIVPVPNTEQRAPYGQTTEEAVDIAAFQTNAEPKPDIKSKVLITRLDQDSLVDPDHFAHGRRPLYAENYKTDLSSYDGTRIQHLAEVLVDSVYLNKTAVLATQRGLNNAVENGLELSDYFQKGLRFLPGGSSLVDIYHGEYANAVRDLGTDIAIYVFTEGAGKLWTVAKSGAAWAAAKASAKFVERFGIEEGAEIELKDVTTTSTVKSLGAVNRMQGNPLADQLGDELVAAADKSDGTVIRSGSTQQIKLTAVRQDGKWYAYDAKTGAAYGPALERFISDTSSAVRQETFSDGTQALVTQRPLAADAYTLPRTHGFDLVNEGKVYRYDARAPGVLSDLESADHFKPLEGFEAICSAPAIGAARIRRGTDDNCFTKVIEAIPEESARELQALEHRRLFPSQRGLLSKDQFVIFERRKYKMVDGEMGPQLVPTADGKRIVYKSKIGGSLKQDPQFGFTLGKSTEKIAEKTRVVTLDSISDACKDKRELRGVIVDGPASKHLVIEADTAEFYHAILNDAPGGKLTFKQCTYDDISMVKKYRETFTRLQGATGAPLDADFIALPKLSDAFKELEHLNYSKQKLDELKTLCKEFTPVQQREVLYQLQRSNAIGRANIGLKPNQVSALTTPADFATWTLEQKNGFFAQEAKKSVSRSMKTTGLGPGNQIRSSADSARAQAARITTGWLREVVADDALNRSDLILKAGAGNCGEMAMVSRDIVRKSGGRAYEWAASDAHAFTVIGGPSTLPAGTVDFSEAAWADAWIVDPWADIASPASLYTQKLNEVMTQWEREDLKIMDKGMLMSPLDRTWMNTLILRPKTPYKFGYAGA
jgi:hypothetical protein